MAHKLQSKLAKQLNLCDEIIDVLIKENKPNTRSMSSLHH